MNKIGRKLQTRTMNLLRGLLTLAVTFVLLTVVLQLQVEYNLLICISLFQKFLNQCSFTGSKETGNNINLSCHYLISPLRLDLYF